ncbi:hypothetical protein QBE52_11955 [Clostridiaceae bacterium 35-E11]
MGDIDKKKMAEFMKTMDNMQPNQEQKKMMEQISERYSDKSEEEIMKELKKLKKSLMMNSPKFKKQMEAVEQLKDFLDEDQKKKLEKMMEFLNASDKEE